MSRDPSRHPDEDVLAERYVLLDGELSERGYGWYEVSNWSRPGHECQHNQLYWAGGDYAGFGAAAHGHRAGIRSWNRSNLTAYLDAIEAGGSAVAGVEHLTAEQQALERISLGLRTRRGIPSSWVEPPEGLDGLVEADDDRLVLTLQGRLLADAVLARLVTTPGGGEVAR